LKDSELMPIWNYVQQHPVPDIGAQTVDSWLWTLTKSGSFSFSSTWDHVRKHGVVYPFFNMILFHNYSPKMSLCLLSALKLTPNKSTTQETQHY